MVKKDLTQLVSQFTAPLQKMELDGEFSNFLLTYNDVMKKKNLLCECKCKCGKKKMIFQLINNLLVQKQLHEYQQQLESVIQKQEKQNINRNMEKYLDFSSGGLI